MGIWGDLGKAVASSLLSEMESTGRKYSGMTNDPDKAANAMRTAESARKLRSYIEDDD